MYVPLGSCTERHEAVVVSWPFPCSSLLGSVMSSHANIRDNLSREIERADNEGSELMSKRVERGGRKGRRGQDRRDEGDERGGRKERWGEERRRGRRKRVVRYDGIK